MSDFTIKALTPETFDDFAALVERNKGLFASCWCTHFHPDCAEKGQSAEGNRALKQRLVADGIAHAALVYDGDRSSPGRSTDHQRDCPTSITARSTSPLPSDCPTTGSPASWSNAAFAVRAWRRSLCGAQVSKARYASGIYRDVRSEAQAGCLPRQKAVNAGL